MTSQISSCCNSSSQSSACGCGSSNTEITAILPLPPIDKRGDVLCRLSNKFRMSYSIHPGLYSIGNPDELSPVLVTANYRLTCDHLQETMGKSNVWVLVLDTKGINVWCAAGKGTFGTSELINRIKLANLETVVKHNKIILPQLGAPGISAHEVTKATGFKVSYGPILARDIPAYLEAGQIATDRMRTVSFTLKERFVLTPIELFPALKKFVLVILGIVILMGLQPEGLLFSPAVLHSWPIIALGVLSIVIGTVLFPVLLPLLPFRSFAVNGAFLGTITIAPSIFFVDRLYLGSSCLALAVILFYITLISYLSLNFTGCTPFTNISGVKREMQFSVPAYITICLTSAIMLIIFKLQEWSLL